MIIWPLLVVTAVFGWLDELRDYYEFYVIAVPLMAMTFARHVFKLDVSARREELTVRHGLCRRSPWSPAPTGRW